MKCGNCTDGHETVAEVRACYGVQAGHGSLSKTAADETFTHKQRNFIERLQAERGMALLPEDVQLTKREASNLIGDLLSTPKSPAPEKVAVAATGLPASVDITIPVSPPNDPTANVPAGFYATPSITGNNDLDFWKVERPTEGRWSGYTFVKRVIGGHDDARLPGDSKKRISRDDVEKVAHVTQKTALRAIVDYGVDESAKLFGTELKYCGTCGIHLTDETSRALGIGPVCRDK